MDKFDHERLDVYRVSIDFVSMAEKISANLPKGRAYLADQLQRAALSISLNIAEGAGEYSRKDKARFYRMALRSATECAAVLDAGERTGLIDGGSKDEGRGMLLRIVSMLTRMVKKLGVPGTGTGAGTGTD